MFKTEAHLHTREVSPCGELYAEEMLLLYKELGYDTVFVTDHFTRRYFDGLGELEPAEKARCFAEGYRNAARAGAALGVNVIFAAEVELDCIKNHYLLYGITEEQVADYDRILSLDPKGLYEYAKERDIFVVQAHPCRDNANTPMFRFVDAAELYNTHPGHKNYTERVLEALKDFPCLPVVAGSDAHGKGQAGRSAALTEFRITSCRDYARAVRSGELVIFTQKND